MWRTPISLRCGATSFELGVDRGRPQVHPADDPGDERMRVGEGQQPPRLLEALRTCTAMLRSNPAPRISRSASSGMKSRCSARIESSSHGILDGIVLPVVLVRVDPDRGKHDGSRSAQAGIGVPP